MRGFFAAKIKTLLPETILPGFAGFPEKIPHFFFKLKDDTHIFEPPTKNIRVLPAEFYADQRRF
ncbi:MAG: hypothetical protein DYG98_17110 [Haliscomenobacteraceae bacterium CHB4]|nr:hypothetical protein [Haliscomenobacteraceae bacterium CHB4]